MCVSVYRCVFCELTKLCSGHKKLDYPCRDVNTKQTTRCLPFYFEDTLVFSCMCVLEPLKSVIKQSTTYDTAPINTCTQSESPGRPFSTHPNADRNYRTTYPKVCVCSAIRYQQTQLAHMCVSYVYFQPTHSRFYPTQSRIARETTSRTSPIYLHTYNKTQTHTHTHISTRHINTERTQ